MKDDIFLGRVLQLVDLGFTNKQICALVKCNARTAARYRAMKNIKTVQYNGGKKRKLPVAKKQLMVRRQRLAKSRAEKVITHHTVRKTKRKSTKLQRKIPAHGSARSVANSLFKDHGIQISVRHMRRVLRSAKLDYRIRGSKTFTDDQIAKRLAFVSNEVAGHTFESFLRDVARKTVFTDESWATADDDSSRGMWVSSKMRILPRESKARNNTISVMYWAAIGYNYKSPVRFVVEWEDEDGKKKRTLTADKYHTHLVQSRVAHFCGENGYRFMQDGARIHTAPKPMNYLRQHCQVIEAWPAGSPDMNPIELVWGDVKRRVSKLGLPGTVDELKALVEQAWNEIPQETINNHIDRYAKQVFAVKAAGGGYVPK